MFLVSFAQPSVDSGDAKNSKIQSGERPMTPFLQDFVDPSTGYHPNFYPSSAYYYGSKLFFFEVSIRCFMDFCTSEIQILNF